ncbi:uncharacterized protein LOC130611439 [Pezoporus wallicus]|uniref:uncharacterized protein LOC130611439 n=1 Tax=Pezoporus wallicus TaxID=35540 RepID=UPI0025501909|nr:uncharacterized protein LOC130611439 [Pezoporus wallicus]
MARPRLGAVLAVPWRDGRVEERCTPEGTPQHPRSVVQRRVGGDEAPFPGFWHGSELRQAKGFPPPTTAGAPPAQPSGDGSSSAAPQLRLLPGIKDTMVSGSPGWCLLVGLCTLVPATTQRGPEEDVTPSFGLEELGYHISQDGDPLQDPQRCGITFHTPSPCSSLGPTAFASRNELDHLKSLLQDTKASLKDVEMAATLEENQTRYQDIITEALPAIHEANLEFQESLDNVRRELEAHVSEADHPRTAEKKEKLRKAVHVVSHMLRLTGRLAQTLDAASQRLDAELSQRLQSSAATATEP